MPFLEKYPISPEARDFTLPAQGERAILLVHGLAATPYHFREYAAFFNERGIHVRALRLPGHGTHISDLAASSWPDWRAAVHRELEALSAAHSKIYLLGYSFGANLAIDAAFSFRERLAGLILFSPAFSLRREQFLRFATRFLDRYTPIKYWRKPWRRRRRRIKGSYLRLPVKSVAEFFYFIDNFTKRQLPQVQTPALVMQPDEDPILRLENAQRVYDRLGAADKKLVILDSDEHTILSDDIRRQAFAQTLDFILRH